MEPLVEKEKELYVKIEFDVKKYLNEVGASKPLKETKVCFYIKIILFLI